METVRYYQQRALRRVLKACEHADLDQPCPIIETLSGRPPSPNEAIIRPAP